METLLIGWISIKLNDHRQSFAPWLSKHVTNQPKVTGYGMNQSGFLLMPVLDCQ
jgi:hypothetical protein